MVWDLDIYYYTPHVLNVNLFYFVLFRLTICFVNVRMLFITLRALFNHY